MIQRTENMEWIGCLAVSGMSWQSSWLWSLSWLDCLCSVCLCVFSATPMTCPMTVVHAFLVLDVSCLTLYKPTYLLTN